ncbi:hypothetical protein D3C81_2279390 [compost metagenome]
MIGAQGIGHAIGQGRLNGVAVALAAQGRAQAVVRVEEADVHIGQVQAVGRHVGGDRQAFALGGAQQVQARRGR